jgi:hypothetical protein
MCRLSWNPGTSASWNHQGLFRPVIGLLKKRYAYLPAYWSKQTFINTYVFSKRSSVCTDFHFRFRKQSYHLILKWSSVSVLGWNLLLCMGISGLKMQINMSGLHSSKISIIFPYFLCLVFCSGNAVWKSLKVYFKKKWSEKLQPNSYRKIQQDATVYQNFISYLHEAQHVSGDTPPITRSLKLHYQPLILHTWKVVGRVRQSILCLTRPTTTWPTTLYVCKTRGY